MTNRRSISAAVLVAVLTLFASVPQSQAQPNPQLQCQYDPPLVQNNPDSVIIDFGFCIIFPGNTQGFDVTRAWTVPIVNAPISPTTITLNYQSPDPMTTQFHVSVCDENCQHMSSPALLAGTSNMPEDIAGLPPFAVVVFEEASIYDYSPCWLQGYYCYYSASLTLH